MEHAERFLTLLPFYLRVCFKIRENKKNHALLKCLISKINRTKQKQRKFIQIYNT